MLEIANLSTSYAPHSLSYITQNPLQLLQHLWEGVSYGIFLLDVLDAGTEFRYLAFNPTMARISPIDVEQLVGKTLTEALPESVRRHYRDRYYQCVQSGQPLSFQECFHHNDVETWWQLTVHPLCHKVHHQSSPSAGQSINQHIDQHIDQPINQLLVTAIEITEQVHLQAEEQQRKVVLAASEAKFRSLVEDANDVIVTWNVDDVLTYISPSFQTLFGYDPSDWLGKTFVPLVHPDDLLACDRINQQLRETGEKVSGFEFRHRCQQGDWVWVSMSIAPIKDGNGTCIAYQGSLRDIHQSKQREIAMRFIVEETAAKTGADFFRSCVRALSEIFQTQYAFIAESVDQTFAQSNMLVLWTGTDFVEPYTFDLSGTPCRMVFEYHWGIFPDQLQAQFPTATGLATLNAESYVGVVINNSQGEAIGNLGIIDIAPLHNDLETVKSILQLFATRVGAEMERNNTEMRLKDYADEQAKLYATSQVKSQALEIALQENQRAQARMVQTEKMSSLGQLVAGIAHEINNPVNFIHGNVIHVSDYAQSLLDLVNLYQQTYPQPSVAIADHVEAIDFAFLNEDLPKLLTSMKFGTERIREIVRSLRLFSRLDEAEVKAVNIHDGIESTLMILQNRLKASAKYSEIKVIKQYSELPLVECFAGQLNQVFMNVLVNAIDAIEERRKTEPQHSGMLKITTEVVENEQIRIRFADSGTGIPEAIQPQIFDPFFTTKEVGKGTGMGMSISYQIVTEKHGGEISCRSTPQQGTEFVIQIPIHRHCSLL
jgi:two-component system, NtrC family, sensor kinase